MKAQLIFSYFNRLESWKATVLLKHVLQQLQALISHAQFKALLVTVIKFIGCYEHWQLLYVD